MKRPVYHYRFRESAPIDEIEATFQLSLMAVESLHGQARLRMDGRYGFCAERRHCSIDATHEVGSDLACIFIGYVMREFGNGVVVVGQMRNAERGMRNEDTEISGLQSAAHSPQTPDSSLLGALI